MNTTFKYTANTPAIQPMGYKSAVFFVCLVGALGGLLFGLDQGFIGNSLETIKTVYQLNTDGAEHYSAILATGGILGALLSGIFARILGRKRSLILAGLTFTIASVGSAFLPSLFLLTLARFFLGFGVGVASFVTPLYLSETAPASIRGSMGTLFQLMITIGIFAIALSNVYIVKTFTNPHVSLSLMFLVIAVFAFCMLLGSLFLPESPRWLMLKGREDQARSALNKVLTSAAEINLEINEIKRVIHEEQSSPIRLLMKGTFIKVLLIGVFLQIFQQLVGINVMIYYSPTIFGYADMKGLIGMMAVPTVNMLFTIPAVFLVDKWGRKKLLIVGAIMMGLSMFAAGFAFHHIDQMAGAAVHASDKTMLLTAIIVYIFGFAFSWGPVAWLVCSEIFPLKGREMGMTITTMVNWTFAGLVMRYSLSFMENYGRSTLFYIFSGLSIVAIIFVKFAVPETKRMRLEELEEKLKS